MPEDIRSYYIEQVGRQSMQPWRTEGLMPVQLYIVEDECELTLEGSHLRLETH